MEDMNLDELQKSLDEAYDEYWSIEDSYHWVEYSKDHSEEERASILRDLQDSLDEISMRIDEMNTEIEWRVR